MLGDGLDSSAKILKREGFSIRQKPVLEEKYVADIGMLLLGPGQGLEADVLLKAVKLKVIGCLGPAAGNVDIELCRKLGIVVFDDPRQNANNGTFIARRMRDFINTGATYLSANFPNLQLPKILDSHRLIHVHHNVPGIMARINGVFAAHRINISGQFLMTRKEIGYCITDIEKDYDKKLIRDLKKIEHTIKFRILY